jgi:nucleoside-diphosphate-sugar epimerase
MHNNTILLTGATGFLGSHLLKKLIDLKCDIIILKRTFSNLFRIEKYMDDIKFYDLDNCSLEKVFSENSINVILHTATQYGRKEESIIDIVESNLMLPLKLIGLAKNYGVQTFINTDTLLDKRVSSYALSKKQFRNWLQFYSKDMVCINVSLEHFFGPQDDPTKFVTFIIKSLIKQVESLDLTMGEQERDFIYIDDVVNAFVKIIQNDFDKNGFYEYEIGSGVNIKIKDFILLVAKILDNNQTKLNFGAIPYRENEVMKSYVNLSKISELGWSVHTSLEDGLKKTILEEKRLVI